MQIKREIFASLIKEKRAEKKLSLRELDKISGVSFSTIARLESGNITPTLDSATRLAKALGFGLDDVNTPLLNIEPGLDQISFLSKVPFKHQHINAGRRKNISKMAIPYEWAIVTNGVLLIVTGQDAKKKIEPGTRLNCSILRRDTVWVMAMTDADIFWIGQATPLA
jgi:transcriptional regulator with XRE-family HTH domain